MRRVSFMHVLTFGFVFVLAAACSGVPLAENHVASPASQTRTLDSVTVKVNPHAEMTRLLREMDKDRDRRITLEDFARSTVGPHSSGKATGPASAQGLNPVAGFAWTFQLRASNGSILDVPGLTPLSNLLQELKLAIDEDRDTISGARVFEKPVARLARLIRERYWDGLTRRVDESDLANVLRDAKLPDTRKRHLYVPFDDDVAFAYFDEIRKRRPELNFDLWRLPARLDAQTWREISGRHGLLGLALETDALGRMRGVPFVVPGGRFNEMYGWDSYFEALGLLEDGRVDLAKAMVDNFVYQIRNYGKILNANRSYYLNRSQPPFLTSMIQAVHAKMPQDASTRIWLTKALEAAIIEYWAVWHSPERVTPSGLNRYYGSGHGIPPEVEPGHFDFVLKPAARRHGLSLRELARAYNSGSLKDPDLDAFFAHDRAVRESGHDTTYRWRVGTADRAADFVTVDLNSLLYKTELDIAKLIRVHFGNRFEFAGANGHETPDAWLKRAALRREKMLELLWDSKRRMFFDFNFKDGTRSKYVSATAFYPFWAQDPARPETRLLDLETSRASMVALLGELEAPGGVLASSRASLEAVRSRPNPRQWDYPNGWAPHQMMIWSALATHGEDATAQRLIYKWLYTITRNAADFNGTVPEKFDVVRRSHAVFAEYGNVGTEFAYITNEGFGWMNASFQVGLARLRPDLRDELNALRPPEWLRVDP